MSITVAELKDKIKHVDDNAPVWAAIDENGKQCRKIVFVDVDAAVRQPDEREQPMNDVSEGGTPCLLLWVDSSKPTPLADK